MYASKMSIIGDSGQKEEYPLILTPKAERRITPFRFCHPICRRERGPAAGWTIAQERGEMRGKEIIGGFVCLASSDCLYITGNPPKFPKQTVLFLKTKCERRGGRV